MKYTIKPTLQFKRDLKLMKRRGCDRKTIEDVIGTLAEGRKLDPKYLDHDLTGNWKGCRECHIAPDWLLVYQIFETDLILSLVRTGSHSDLAF